MRIPRVSLPLAAAYLTGFCLTGFCLIGFCLAGLLAAGAGPHPADGPLATGRLATGRLATGRLATGRLATGRLATGRLAIGPAAVSPAAEGILAGHLYAVGGVAPGAPRPWPGTVTLTAPGVHRDVSVSAAGRYSALVPAGTYGLAGRSPLYQSGTGVCRAAGPATVTTGHRTEADVLCQLK